MLTQYHQQLERYKKPWIKYDMLNVLRPLLNQEGTERICLKVIQERFRFKGYTPHQYSFGRYKLKIIYFEGFKNQTIYYKILESLLSSETYNGIRLLDSPLTSIFIDILSQSVVPLEEFYSVEGKIGAKLGKYFSRIDRSKLVFVTIDTDRIKNSALKQFLKLDNPSLKRLALGNTAITTDCIQLFRKSHQEYIQFVINYQSNFNPLRASKEAHYTSRGNKLSCLYFSTEDQRNQFIYLPYSAKNNFNFELRRRSLRFDIGAPFETIKQQIYLSFTVYRILCMVARLKYKNQILLMNPE